MQVVSFADFSRHVEKSTKNLTPSPPYPQRGPRVPPSLQGLGEKSKPLSLQERGLERGLPDKSEK